MAASFPIRILNTFMRAMLRSPLHGMASKTVLLLSVEGRKSGKNISVPVSYSREGSRITIFSSAAWVKNLEGGAPVSLRIQGIDYQGYAIPNATDLKAKSEGLTRHLSAVRGDAKYFKVTFDKSGKPDRQQIEAAADKNTMIRVRLKK
jgi:hypothetical protein